MVGRRGEAPLVSPYRFHRPNNAMALAVAPWQFRQSEGLGIVRPAL